MAGDAKSERSNNDEMAKKSLINPDPSSKSGGDANNTAPKDGISDANSCISSVDAMGCIKEADLDQEPIMAEQPVYYPASGYYGYYYPSPGFENAFVDWNDPSYYVGADGLDLQQTAIQPDGSLVYYMPGYLPAYDPYGVMSPGAAVYGADGQPQYLASTVQQQPYVMSSVMSPQHQHQHQQPLGSPAYYSPPSVLYGPGGYFPAGTYPWESYYTAGFDGGFGVPNAKPKAAVAAAGVGKKNGSAAPTSGGKLNTPPEKKGLSVDVTHSAEVPALALKHGNKPPLTLAKPCFPASKLPSYAHQAAKPGMMLYAESDKPKPPYKTNNNNSPAFGNNFDLLAEQNRGPRTNSNNNNNSKTATWVTTGAADPILAAVPSTTAATGAESDDKAGAPAAAAGGGAKTVIIRRDDYNLPEFPTKYEHALFFVIKSYSEDDIHKSIKYNVWASTPNGNKRLDAAFQAAQEKASEKGGVKCPVFLFFSVNASGQFCGVAEMTGRVDFSKNMDFWQQDKWNGYFPVKWHMIKDVPNPQFRHIILENNDHKPVTNSRDTQEVRFPQGTEMLTIFKGFSSRTSILDDFGFYENRQKVMLEKRSRMVAAAAATMASPPSLAQFLPKLDETCAAVKKTPAVVAVEEVTPVISGLEALDLNKGVGEDEAALVNCE